MSSLARRGLRTTVAVAGLAALGAGLAAPAFAASDLPATPAVPDLPGAPDLSAAQNALASLPAPTSLNPAELPPLFTFEMPKIETAAPAMPSVPSLPSAPSASDVVNADNATPALPDPMQLAQDNSFGLPDPSALPTATAMSIAGHMIASAPQDGAFANN